MSSSNLPPGCSSPDGGIDHAFEQAAEKLLDGLSADDIEALFPFSRLLRGALQSEFAEGLREGRSDLEREVAYLRELLDSYVMALARVRDDIASLRQSVRELETSIDYKADERTVDSLRSDLDRLSHRVEYG